MASGPRLLDPTNAPMSVVLHTATYVNTQLAGSARDVVMVVGGINPSSSQPGASVDVLFFDEASNQVFSVLKMSQAVTGGAAAQLQFLQTHLPTSPGQMKLGSTTTQFVIDFKYGHTATKLSDGRVLIAGGGGWDTGTNPPSGGGVQVTATASMHVFDPTTGTFTLVTTQLTHPRVSHTAVLDTSAGHDQVYIVGGSDNSGNTVAQVEIVDVASAGAMPTVIAGPSSSNCTNFSAGGNIQGVVTWGGLIQSAAGGGLPVDNPSSPTKIVPGLNLTATSATGIGSISLAGTPVFDSYEFMAQGVVVGTQLWVGGGFTLSLPAGATSLSTIPSKKPVIISTPTGTNQVGPSFVEARCAAAAAALNATGGVLVAGGNDGSGAPASGTTPAKANVYVHSAEYWDAATNMFSGQVNMIQQRGNATATSLPNGHVAVIGGSRGSTNAFGDDGTPSEQIEVYSK